MDFKLNTVAKSVKKSVSGIVSKAYQRIGLNRKEMVGAGELGRPGFRYYLPGWIKRDYLPELAGRDLWLVYQEMGDNDAYCGAALNAYAMFIRRSGWKAQPASKRTQDLEAAEFLDSVMLDMQHGWRTFIALAAKAVPQFGFAPFEIVYKVRSGWDDDPRKSSKFDDGAVGIANLAFRSPDTVLHWDYDPNDVTRLIGLTQLAAPDFKPTFIPIEKILLLRAEPGKDSPEGRSILRSAYRSWIIKKTMEDLRNIIIERGGAGIPWVEAPTQIANAPSFYAQNPNSPEAKAAIESYNTLREMLEGIVIDKSQWIITPQVYDDEGNPLIKVGFLQPSVGADIIGHINRAIDTEAKAILQSTLTEFLALGMGASGGGSLALSRDKTDNFTLAVTAYLDAFEASINNQLVPRLFRLNPQFEDLTALPKVIHEPVVPLSTADISAVVNLFHTVGWDLSNQRTIRDAILYNVGLPEYEDPEASESETGDGDAKSGISTMDESKLRRRERREWLRRLRERSLDTGAENVEKPEEITESETGVA
mgnify:CR=1 FL=1